MPEDKSLAKIQFKQYVVENLSFKINPEFVASEEKEIELDISFNHEFLINTEAQEAQLNLGCNVFGDYLESNKPFFLDLKLVGIFTYSADMEMESLNKMLLVNASAILFPYLRATVSSITALCNVPAVMLPTYNIHKMLEDVREAAIDLPKPPSI